MVTIKDLKNIMRQQFPNLTVEEIENTEILIATNTHFGLQYMALDRVIVPTVHHDKYSIPVVISGKIMSNYPII